MLWIINPAKQPTLGRVFIYSHSFAFEIFIFVSDVKTWIFSGMPWTRPSSKSTTTWPRGKKNFTCRCIPDGLPGTTTLLTRRRKNERKSPLPSYFHLKLKLQEWEEPAISFKTMRTVQIKLVSTTRGLFLIDTSNHLHPIIATVIIPTLQTKRTKSNFYHPCLRQIINTFNNVYPISSDGENCRPKTKALKTFIKSHFIWPGSLVQHWKAELTQERLHREKQPFQHSRVHGFLAKSFRIRWFFCHPNCLRHTQNWRANNILSVIGSNLIETCSHRICYRSNKIGTTWMRRAHAVLSLKTDVKRSSYPRINETIYIYIFACSLKIILDRELSQVRTWIHFLLIILFTKTHFKTLFPGIGIGVSSGASKRFYSQNLLNKLKS